MRIRNPYQIGLFSIGGGKDEALLFIRGEKIRMLRGDIVSQLVEEVYKL